MRICVQWPRFGPYHLARLRAAHEALAPAGVEVVGLETAADDALYDWRVEDAAEPFRREQAFPGRVYEEVPPAEMHAGTVAALDRIDPDAVGIMSYSYPDARAALWWCRRNRRTAVLMTDTKADDAPRAGWRERIKALLVAEFDAALVAGTPHRDYLLRLGFAAERIFPGYDVVDNAFFHERAEAVRRDPAPHRVLPGLASGGPFFLASARFIARKDLPTLLRAYGAYRQRAETPWGLVLLGDGPLRPELEALVTAQGIAGVTMPGWRQLEEVPAYYGLAGAFVHTAEVDQWALVVNEAMASGLPVAVSTGTGCHVDLVRPGENGFTFRPGDAETLSRHLQALAHEVDREAFARSAREAVAAFPLDLFGRNLHRAALAGAARGRERGPGLRAGGLIFALRLLARSPRSFHSVES